MADTHDLPDAVVVTGDVSIDWNLARTRRSEGGGAVWNADDCTRAYWQRGGAALLADLIDAVARELRGAGQAECQVRRMGAPAEPVHPGDARYHHSYALWSLFKYGVKSPLDRDRPAWRVEEFLGLDRSAVEGVPGADWKLVVDDTPEARIVVLDDADLGFREHPELWPRAITTEGRRPWILLKMARPVAQGKLWEHLHQSCAERLIVVMTVNDLRLTEVQISRELSWERTAQDLAWELVYNPRVNALSHCAHVVISFHTDGAFLLSRSQGGGEAGGEPKCRLFFDPAVIEDMWGQSHPGGMIGYTSCLTAGIARRLMLSREQPDIGKGIQSGLAAMRKLHSEGYGVRGEIASKAQLAFPIGSIADALAGEKQLFAETEVREARFLTQPAAGITPHPALWTILEDRRVGALDAIARQIVIEGAESALQAVPLGQFGNLLTVDRREIESFRSIRTLVSEYCRQIRQKRPLSIAVFGAPGSGKSFGIIEVANSLLPDQIKVLEFNLSQRNDPAELLQALHQVRDVGLSGLIPLVFWDEFDTTLAGNALGWLRYFLAPMQDGSFQEGQITHPIGRSIFVFAGGTSSSMETFGQRLGPEKFRAAKGPDFISRLKGYVNILGPNRQKPADDAPSVPDPYYIVRRAILLRSALQRNAPQLLHKKEGKQLMNIDQGVLRAFLETQDYKHGVRSMEAIIAMSLLAGKTRFERSSLPSEAQLDLHVNGQDFLALIHRMDLEGELLEKLAEAAHELFCEELRAKGYRWGPQTNDELRTHSSLKAFAELPEDEREQNRGLVRDIPSKLARVGCIMVPARSNETFPGFAGSALESLSEMEHGRWMKAKIEAGWRWAAETNKEQNLHKDILPWRLLSFEEMARLYTPAENAAIGEGTLAEEEKEKDRKLVRGIPQMLAKVGYTVVKLKDELSKAAASGIDSTAS
jgi:RyR domain